MSIRNNYRHSSDSDEQSRGDEILGDNESLVKEGQSDKIQIKDHISMAGKLWADTAIMQTLEEKIGSGSSSTIADLRDRGSETYALDGKPPQKLDLLKRKRKRHYDDALSDEMGEECNSLSIKQFTIRKEERTSNLADNELQKSETGNEEKDHQIPIIADPLVELWEGVDTTAVEPIEKQQHQQGNLQQHSGRNGGRRQQFKRFKSGNNWKQQRGSDNEMEEFKKFQNKTIPKYNKSNKKFLPPDKFLPRRLLAINYDQEKLFNAIFDAEKFDSEQLAQEMVIALGEQEPDIIRKVIEFAGKPLSVELFKKCQAIEKEGGMLTKKGDRRKTPGGVFLQIFNECGQIDSEHKKAVYMLGQELMAKKGGWNRPKWWDKREKNQFKKKMEHQEKSISPPPDIEVKYLPKCNELIKPDDTEKQGDPDPKQLTGFGSLPDFNEPVA